ncbi:ROK family transcriptional regulator [Marinitoga sp. 38H-ov]|uniref:ROK family transcriptional regulator n=1 Tax=Marinitoga sp. 38H-ov TaxID=1755814 RepID=UPI0013EBB6BD|nr:ROK family transcriptional regulator [Marinitoga sp. 38H-ov]KAF2956770.1 ROK family transcriptional regulator [Marinitoga sp. 38H-ov]
MKYNSEEIKKLNMKNILRILHINSPISRNELVHLTELRPSSITRLTRELIEKNYIYEVGTGDKKTPGRKEILLDINKNAFKAFVVDIGVNETVVGIGYFNGKVDVKEKFLTSKKPEVFFKRIQKLYEKYNKKEKIDTISFSVPGLVNVEENIILLAPNLEWENVNIGSYLNVDVPILSDNEANLSVMAEKYHAEDLKNKRNIVFIEIREGIGTGLIINNELYRGFTYNGGEFGHTIIEFNSKEKCHCSNTGCWELYGSINYALKNYNGILNGKDAIEKFNNLKNKTDAKEILLDLARNNSIGIANIINSLNPEVIIIGGELNDMPKYFYEELINETKKKILKVALKNTIIRPTIFKNISSNLVGAGIFSINKFIEKI